MRNKTSLPFVLDEVVDDVHSLLSQVKLLMIERKKNLKITKEIFFLHISFKVIIIFHKYQILYCFYNIKNRLRDLSQLYKNRFCGLVVIPEVINDIRLKCGTFDWLRAN